MKLKTLLLAGTALAMSPLAAQAQTHFAFPVKAKDKAAFRQELIRQLSQPAPSKAARRSTAKTTALASRVIGYASRTFSGSSFSLTDSAKLGYSGSRPGTIDMSFPHCDYGIYLSYDDALPGMAYTDSVGQAFDASDRPVSRTYKEWNSGAGRFETTNRELLGYKTGSTGKDADTTLTQEWDGSSFTDNSRVINTYDAAGNIIRQEQQGWDGSSWISYAYATLTYSATNKLLQTEVYIDLGAGPMLFGQGKNVYDASDYLTSDTTLSIDMTDFSLVYTNYNTYTNDASGNALSRETFSWDAGSTTWLNSTREYYSYTGSNRTGTVYSTWNDGVSKYDTSHRVLNTFNSYDQMETERSETWNPGSGSFAVNTDDYSDRYYYEEYSTTSVKEHVAIGGKASIYPVPAQQELTVALKWNEAQDLTLQLSDVSGRTLLQLHQPMAAEFTQKLNLEAIPSGHYFLQLHGNKGGKVVQQVVVAH